MKHLVQKFSADESGATAIEYGLIAALIAIVSIAAMTTVGQQLKSKFTAVGTKLRTTSNQ